MLLSISHCCSNALFFLGDKLNLFMPSLSPWVLEINWDGGRDPFATSLWCSIDHYITIANVLNVGPRKASTELCTPIIKDRFDLFPLSKYFYHKNSFFLNLLG